MHTGMSLCGTVAGADDPELGDAATGTINALADEIGNFPEVFMARNKVTPRIGNADDWPVKIIVRTSNCLEDGSIK
jgi:hypothetical protein